MVMTHPDVSRELVRQHREQLHAEAARWRRVRQARATATHRSRLPLDSAALAAVIGRSIRRLVWPSRADKPA
jgi:hypothetical protein